MTIMEKLLIFQIEEQNFAIPLDVVDVVINVVEINELPHSSYFILGVINYYGEVLPVIDLRYLFQLKYREIEVSDKLIIIKSGEQTICLLVDKIGDIVRLQPDMIKKNNSFFMELNYIDGIFILEENIVFLQNVDKLFTKEEMQKLHELISKHKQKSKAKKLNISIEKARVEKDTKLIQKKKKSAINKRIHKSSSTDTQTRSKKKTNPKEKRTD